MCIGCGVSKPDDQQLNDARNAAKEQSKTNKEPVAIYKEAGEYKLKNAYSAYADGDPVAEIVSEHNKDADLQVLGM